MISFWYLTCVYFFYFFFSCSFLPSPASASSVAVYVVVTVFIVIYLIYLSFFSSFFLYIHSLFESISTIAIVVADANVFFRSTLLCQTVCYCNVDKLENDGCCGYCCCWCLFCRHDESVVAFLLFRLLLGWCERARTQTHTIFTIHIGRLFGTWVFFFRR